MKTISDLAFLTANQLAKAIRKREISVAEVIEAYLSRIARYNPALNAIVTSNKEAARKRAKEADAALGRGEIWGRLHGVPITIKDTFETAGLRTTSSYKPLANHIPHNDATVVTRLLDAGAIILGKTNMPELARDTQSNSPLFGRANNPWDLNRTPGGSTGGGAAAVAAGLSALEIGSDIGGSIRIPAHYCGVFGLKPTEHLVSGGGHIPDLPGEPRSARHMGTFGPLARSVADLKLCLSIIAGPDDRDWDVPPVPLAEPTERALSDLCFAWTDDFGGVPVTIETRSVLENLAKELAALGCQVVRQNPPGFDFDLAWRIYGEILGAETAVSIPSSIRMLGQLLNPIVHRHEPIHQGISRGLGLSMHRYMTALTERDSLIAVMEGFLAEYDAWLCPVASTPAFTHRRPAVHMPGQPIEVDDRMIPYSVATMSHTTIFNLTGNPVVVLPAGRAKDNLPIGVQVVGRRWRDMELLAVGSHLAEVTGPFHRVKLRL